MHIMKLKEQYFNYIKFGTKTYEIRLNDEKRQKIKIGDYIEFQKEPLKEEKIIYKVDDLLYFKNFEELINKIDITLLASSKETKEELLKTLNSFYNAEEQKKYGVVAIKLDKSKLFTIEKCFLTNISSNNKIFNIIKNDYNDFGKWYNKLLENNEECYFTKDKDGIINSILILKRVRKHFLCPTSKKVRICLTLSHQKSSFVRMGIFTFYLLPLHSYLKIKSVTGFLWSNK